MMQLPPEYDYHFIDDIPFAPPPPYSPRSSGSAVISRGSDESSCWEEERVQEETSLSSIPWQADAVTYANHQIEPNDLKTIFASIRRRNLLKHLNLSRNNSSLTDDTLPLLIQTISLCKSLMVLNLSSCSLSTKSAYFLGLFLRANNSLQILMVQDNAFLEDGALAFYKGLSTNPSSRMQVLLFGQQQAEFRPQNVTLRALNVSFNAIMEKGFESIVKGCLNHLIGLEHVHLNSNCLGDSSSQALCELAVHHPTLKTIHLQGNQFSERTLTDLDKSLPYSRSVQAIDFRHNPKIKLKSAGVQHKKKIIWKPKHESTYVSIASSVLGSF